MKRRNQIKGWLAGMALFAMMASCEENSVNPGGSESSGGTGDISDALHLSFKTPDWEKVIDCSHLDLPSHFLDEGVFITSATSASTNNTFHFSFPQDSTAMVAKENLKKYAIAEYGRNTGPFEFSFKVPEKSGSKTNLYSQAGFSENYFNEVISITYESSTEEEAIFKVKCRYQLSAAANGGSENPKDIKGTFHFKVRTTRK